MVNILIQLSKYFLMLCMAFYVLHGFIVFKYSNYEDQKGFFVMQNIFMVMIHACGYGVILLNKQDSNILYLYLLEQFFIIAFIILFKVIYPTGNVLILNNMCMLTTISFIILARLSISKCYKQFVIVAGGFILALIIPFFIKFFKAIFTKITYVTGLIGVIVLGIVLILGSVTYGSKLSFTIKGITFQPSELIKIVFVIFLASMFYKSTDLKKVLISAVIAAMHIGILVLSKDLGSALIFFIVYIMLLYVASRNLLYLIAGLSLGAVGSSIGYRLFSHVRTRVLAWKDPFSVIDGQGYQITQSLFAIGTGNWFGMGLCQGSPEKIPVVEADFIFSAISEEMGCIFSICIILLCISNFLMFMNIALKMRDRFYRYLAVGLSCIYGFQMFLTIGGVTKFIPLTGVTLPLVSYGGTSVLVTIIMFSIIQGIYLLRNHTFEEDDDETDDSDYSNYDEDSELSEKEAPFEDFEYI